MIFPNDCAFVSAGGNGILRSGAIFAPCTKGQLLWELFRGRARTGSGEKNIIVILPKGRFPPRRGFPERAFPNSSHPWAAPSALLIYFSVRAPVSGAARTETRAAFFLRQPQAEPARNAPTENPA